MEFRTKELVRAVQTSCQLLFPDDRHYNGAYVCRTAMKSLITFFDYYKVLINSPVSPMTTFLPLLFVVVVTGIKQGYEDLLRHRSDRKVNLKLVEIVRNGKIEVS